MMQRFYFAFLAALLLTGPVTAAEVARTQHNTDAKRLLQIDAKNQQVRPNRAKNVSGTGREVNFSGCQTICSLLSSR